MPSSSAPLFSVIVPNYNGLTFLGRTLDSIHLAIGYALESGATQPGEIEVLVQDGGSTDGSVDFLKRWEEKHRQNAYGFRFHSARDNGQSDAIAKGFQETSGAWMTYINSDDTYAVDVFSYILPLMRQTTPEVKWIVGHADIINENDQQIRQPITQYKKWLLLNMPLQFLRVQNFICQMGSFFRRDLYVEAGGLDTSLHYCMDYDLWLRFAQIEKPRIVNRVLAHFRMCPGTKSVSGFENQFEEEIAVLRKRLPHDPFSLGLKTVSNFLIRAAYRAMT